MKVSKEGFMLKSSENPPILHPENAFEEELAGRWWVAHTKSRNEKALAWSLYHWQTPYFLPLSEKVTRRKQRTYKSLLPLFTGYLFFFGELEQRHQALTTNRIANVIEVVDQSNLVRELTSIYRALKSGLPIDPHPYLKTGNRCRVIAGPLMGYEGIVEQKKNLTRILLQVDILGQSAAVEIDTDMLEPID